MDRQDLYQEFVVRDDGIHEVSLVNPLFMGVNQPVQFHIQVRLMHNIVANVSVRLFFGLDLAVC